MHQKQNPGKGNYTKGKRELRNSASYWLKSHPHTNWLEIAELDQSQGSTIVKRQVCQRGVKSVCKKGREGGGEMLNKVCMFGYQDF